MSAVYPATEHNIRALSPDGKAVIIEHKNHEVQARFSGLVETGNKKEIAREKAKVEKYRAEMETTNTTIGASPAESLSSTVSYEKPEKLWRRKERYQLREFLKLKRKWEREVIPLLKREYERKLLEKFGTLDEKVLEKRLNIEMQADPRLDIRTHRGVVLTTVAMQAQFASESRGQMETVKKT